MGLSGKVALITGASQRIGRAIALRLARDGADIAIVDVNEGKAKVVAREVTNLDRKATTFKADVTKRDDVYRRAPRPAPSAYRMQVLAANTSLSHTALAAISPHMLEKCHDDPYDRYSRFQQGYVFWTDQSRRPKSDMSI